MDLRVVVFPAPFIPMNPVIKPPGTWKDISLIQNEGYALLSPLTSSMNRLLLFHLYIYNIHSLQELSRGIF
jgi:hypothetical protein